MNKKRRVIGILLSIAIIVGGFNASSSKVVYAKENASSNHYIVEYENNELENVVKNIDLENEKSGILSTVIKGKIIKWGIKNLDTIVDSVAPFISYENELKLRSASKGIKKVFKKYQNTKKVLVSDLMGSIQTLLEKKMEQGTAQKISKWIVKILSSQDDDSSTTGNKKTKRNKKYILPYSDERKLTKADLKGLSKEELRLARNEIYARHGRLFLDEELQEYFDSKSWYDGYIEPEDFDDYVYLTKLERRNASFILKFE